MVVRAAAHGEVAAAPFGVFLFERLDDKWLRGVCHNYKDEGRVAKAKVTHRFSVYDRISGTLLGHVKWFAPWRQYTFFGQNPVLMAKMAREIGDFCEHVTRQHKAR